MEDMLKMCPACGTEYRPEVRACADCNTRLVLKQEIERAREPLPFSDRLVAVQTETLDWIKALADALNHAGIRCHIRSTGAVDDGRTMGTSFHYHTLYVQPDDAEAAQRLDRELLGDAAEEEVKEDGRVCAACGALRRAGANECMECGLLLGSTVD
jgi:predicted amidophosphoribosyltransferase